MERGSKLPTRVAASRPSTATTATSRRSAAAQAAVDAVRALCRDVGQPSGLRDVGVPEDALAGFVDGALSAKRLTDNNPRQPTPDAVLAIYRASY